MLSVESQESADAADQIPAPLPVQLIRDAKCMLDWILAAVYVGGIDEKILQVCYRNAADLEGMQIKAQVQEQLRYKRLIDSEKTNAALEEELRARFAFSYPYRQLEKLYTKTIIPKIDKGLSATVYTEVSDVEQEMNGLVTYDRRVIKVPVDLMRKINAQLKIKD